MEALAYDRPLTAEQFYERCVGTDDRLELREGVIVEMSPVSAFHSIYNSVLSRRLGTYIEEHELGDHCLDAGFILSRNPDVVRAPDQAFVSVERSEQSPPPERGFWEVVPDLVIEVVSPEDRVGELSRKVHEYLAAGVRLVWMIYPLERQVLVYRPEGDVRLLVGDAELDGEDVVPGFRIPVSQLWKRRKSED